ncbi:MAG: hypothetical protein P3C10_09940 [Gemmatimonadota bacterium]|nr:hypothetical protein [Gemmatimonadota bacterium]
MAIHLATSLMVKMQRPSQLQRNAGVVLGNVGTAEDLAVLEAMGALKGVSRGTLPPS